MRLALGPLFFERGVESLLRQAELARRQTDAVVLLRELSHCLVPALTYRGQHARHRLLDLARCAGMARQHVDETSLNLGSRAV